jgi:hypothetical protein
MFDVATLSQALRLSKLTEPSCRHETRKKIPPEAFPEWKLYTQQQKVNNIMSSFILIIDQFFSSHSIFVCFMMNDFRYQGVDGTLVDFYLIKLGFWCGRSFQWVSILNALEGFHKMQPCESFTLKFLD